MNISLILIAVVGLLVLLPLVLWLALQVRRAIFSYFAGLGREETFSNFISFGISGLFFSLGIFLYLCLAASYIEEFDLKISPFFTGLALLFLFVLLLLTPFISHKITLRLSVGAGPSQSMEITSGFILSLVGLSLGLCCLLGYYLLVVDSDELDTLSFDAPTLTPSFTLAPSRTPGLTATNTFPPTSPPTETVLPTPTKVRLTVMDGVGDPLNCVDGTPISEVPVGTSLFDIESAILDLVIFDQPFSEVLGDGCEFILTMTYNTEQPFDPESYFGVILLDPNLQTGIDPLNAFNELGQSKLVATLDPQIGIADLHFEYFFDRRWQIRNAGTIAAAQNGNTVSWTFPCSNMPPDGLAWAITSSGDNRFCDSLSLPEEMANLWNPTLNPEILNLSTPTLIRYRDAISDTLNIQTNQILPDPGADIRNVDVLTSQTTFTLNLQTETGTPVEDYSKALRVNIKDENTERIFLCQRHAGATLEGEINRNFILVPDTDASVVCSLEMGYMQVILPISPEEYWYPFWVDIQSFHTPQSNTPVATDTLSIAPIYLPILLK